MFRKLSFTSAITTTIPTVITGISSSTVLFFTTIGMITPAIPRISTVFMILLPMTFPKTISPTPFHEAIMFTTTSGIDVPKATIVMPITSEDTRILTANEEAPLTRKSAPTTRSTNPTRRSRNGINSNTLSLFVQRRGTRLAVLPTPVKPFPHARSARSPSHASQQDR